MKNFNGIYFVALLVIVLTLMPNTEAYSQCAMCKAVAEDGMSDANSGSTAGLNNGILYIMLIPYILLATLAFVFFRKKISGFWKEFNNIH